MDVKTFEDMTFLKEIRVAEPLAQKVRLAVERLVLDTAEVQAGHSEGDARAGEHLWSLGELGPGAGRAFLAQGPTARAGGPGSTL